MAVEEGLRRSTRAKKQVKSYADEQAENEDHALKSKPATKRKKQQQQPEKRLNDETDGEHDEDDDVVNTRPRKKSKKKESKADGDNDYDVKDDVEQTVPKEKTKKKNLKNDNDVVRADGSIKNGVSLFFEGVDRAPEGASWHADAAERRIAASKRNVKKLAPGQKETRLRSLVEDASETYKKALKKANSERMFILSRERGVEDHCHHSPLGDADGCPKETLEIAGSTGNVYTVEISHAPTCTCPVGIFKRKNQETLCKHALYVLHNVLKAPDHLKRQNGFMSSELKEIFANAAPLALAEVSTDTDAEADGGRKAIEGDCPICFMEFEEGEDIVWCRAACGNNIHKGCFEQWASTRGWNVTCPFCRAAWENEGPKKKQAQRVDVVDVAIPEIRGKSGYRNVRELLDYD